MKTAYCLIFLSVNAKLAGTSQTNVSTRPSVMSSALICAYWESSSWFTIIWMKFKIVIISTTLEDLTIYTYLRDNNTITRTVRFTQKLF